MTNAPRPDALPDLSPLQYLALGLLHRGETAGPEMREELAEYGVRRTRAAFYQFMARLERDGLVEGDYEQTESGGRTVTERRYRITADGRSAWAHARVFFEAVERLPAGSGET